MKRVISELQMYTFVQAFLHSFTENTEEKIKGETISLS
jgi:hypothetical protein